MSEMSYDSTNKYNEVNDVGIKISIINPDLLPRLEISIPSPVLIPFNKNSPYDEEFLFEETTSEELEGLEVIEDETKNNYGRSPIQDIDTTLLNPCFQEDVKYEEKLKGLVKKVEKEKRD